KLAAIDMLEQRLDELIAAQLLGAGLDQIADNLDAGFYLVIAAHRTALAGFPHQALHPDRLLPPGQRVVADIGDAARPQFTVEEPHDARAYRLADPAPQPMQGDHIRFGQGY